MEPSLGARAMRVLIQAYAAAAGRNGSAVSTLDVAGWISAYDARLFAGAGWNNVRNFAIAPARVPDAAEPSPGPFHPAVPDILREVEWRARRLPWAAGRPDWTPAVRVVITGALETAQVPFAGPPHLMRAMLDLPHCAGTSFVFPYEKGRAEARLTVGPALRRSDEPHPDLDHVRLMVSPGRRPLRGKLLMRMLRLARVSPLLTETVTEARRQAVRLGHDVIGPGHLMLALLTFDDILTAAGTPISDAHNCGAFLLRAHGIGTTDLRYGLPLRDPTAEELAGQLERLKPGDPFDETAGILARADEISLAHHHPDTGTSHLLLALLDSEAAPLAGDATALRERVAEDLRMVPAAWH
uniref:Clp protease N-terminal domain-containing protein n=1 Tax=Paractinoplanes polyasparticus TaxID=2856853 RepID=UPI001C8668B5|nr:Clp protease N-terminal domain-containing protein [Actinoplanes polyasparticus]